MIKQKPWQWNEYQHVGADFSDLLEVQEYDRKHRQFRDVDAENRKILEQLNLPRGARVLDVGAGTGHFVRAAARAGLCPTAVDISTPMLEYARQEAEKEGLDGIDYVHAGFLSLEFPPATFAAAVSGATLHHLPDTWKAVALRNLHRVLEPGGQFVLCDVVFDWGEQGHARYFDEAVDSLPDEIRPRMTAHVSSEYSTLDWIMEGLLRRAGFRIVRVEKPTPYFHAYHCHKR